MKDNQPTLSADLQQVFEDGLNSDFADVDHDTHTTEEVAHGRLTERTYDAIAIPRDHAQRRRWRDLRTLVLATSCVTVGAKETWETRMFISDLRPRAKSLGHAVRKHWGIENGQHWVLDAQALRQQAAWMVLSATAADMIHDPATAHELNAWNLKGNGLAMTGEGQAMVEHGQAMATQVAQLSETGALTPETADQLVAASEELITTGETLGRDGQRMQETADQMLALIGQ